MKRISVALIAALLTLLPLTAMGHSEGRSLEDSRKQYLQRAENYRGRAEEDRGKERYLRGKKDQFNGRQQAIIGQLIAVYSDLAKIKEALADAWSTRNWDRKEMLGKKIWALDERQVRLFEELGWKCCNPRFPG